MAMVVENGRLYICGLFVLSRLAGKQQAFARRRTMRHEKKRKRGGSSHDLEVTVPVTKWAKRNMEWWLRCFDDADGCPRFRCVQERITWLRLVGGRWFRPIFGPDVGCARGVLVSEGIGYEA